MTEQVKETQAVEAEQTAAPALGIGDLVAMVQVIDIVSERGAFKGPELESVGILRGRIARFIDANKPAQQPVEGTAEAEAVAE